jgi:hypothetical protein
MRGARAFVAVVTVVCATACSAGTTGDATSSSATSSEASTVKNEVYLTKLLPGGSMNFKPGEGVVGGTKYPQSLLTSCEGCLPIGQAGQQNQPGMEFTVPGGYNQLEFVVGLTDSSTETDRHAGVAVYTYASATDAGTKLFESKDVPIGVAIPVSVAVTPSNRIRIDGWGLNGNETLCICDAKLVETR